MLDSALSSVFGTTDSLVASVSTVQFLMCCAASIVLGAAVACIYMFRHKYSKNFVVTLALLPLIVQMVITLVNGNLGAGIAVMGVFNLVRFRSIPGSAKDIGSVFFAMAIGLATGMGFIALAVLFTFIVGVVNVVYVLSPFGRPQQPEKMLRVTVPEDLEFDGMFDAVLARYTAEHELTEVCTTNMGSLYQLEYRERLAQPGIEKRLMDEVRCLNGGALNGPVCEPTRPGGARRRCRWTRGVSPGCWRRRGAGSRCRCARGGRIVGEGAHRCARADAPGVRRDRLAGFERRACDGRLRGGFDGCGKLGRIRAGRCDKRLRRGVRIVRRGCGCV